MRTASVAVAAAVAAIVTTAVGGAGPAGAAAPIAARADASAVSVSVAGQGGYSGTYRVSVRTTGATSASGTHRPAVTVLGGQSLISAGTLAQDARATLRHHAGHSAACAGLAGRGATVAAVGAGRCLRGGRALDLAAGSLDLSHLTIVRSTVLQGLDQQLQQALQPVIGQVTAALSQALAQGTAALGDPGIHLALGAVQANCEAAPGVASGTAHLAGVHAWVSIPTVGDVDVVRLPVDPAPNTRVVTDLGGVARAVQKALRTQLNQALTGALAPLNTAVDQAAVLDNVLDQLSSQLAPLQQNLIDATLNEQTRRPGAIHVTALHLRVLPAAQQFVHAPAVDLVVGKVSCGPDARAAVAPAPSPTPTTPARPAAVPTRIPSGLASAPVGGNGSGTPGTALLGLLAAVGVVAAGAGIWSFRRALRR